MKKVINSKEKQRIEITKFLQWEDRNGCYTDENNDIQGVPRMTYEDAVKYFFGVVNSEFYYSITDNIFELTYDEVINYSKKYNFYNITMYRLIQLFQQTKITEEFYSGLLD